MKNTRRVLILILLAIGAGLLVFETFLLKVEYVDVEIHDLPKAFDGFCLIHLTDFHGRRISPTGKLYREAAAIAPDIIVLTGDYVHSKAKEIHNVTPLVTELSAISPMYAVSGNHDVWTDWPYISQTLSNVGVNVLENSYIRISRGSSELVLSGVGDPYTGQDDLASALPETVTGPVILLAHSPTWFEPRYQEQFGGTVAFLRQRELLDRVDLTLVGHTHGGQIKIPFVGPLTTASGRLFPKTHIEGLILEETGWLYISRGVGQGGLLPIRFLSRPELTVITLRRPNSKSQAKR